MKNFTIKNELFQASHMMILICYSIFSLILVGESILLSWELWAIIPIAVALIGSWILHLMQLLSERARIWIYSLLMMVTSFFYGIHRTSTYDLALVISGVIMIYTMTGISALITLWQVSYYITMGYDIIAMLGEGQKLDSLFVTRSMLHLSMIFMIGFISKTIIKKWQQVLVRSSKEIDRLEDVATRMNDFLANMSHEIRTPINAVIGLTGVCIRKDLSDEVRSDLLAVESAGKRVAEQISDILDFSEIDMGNLAVNTEDYMLSSVLNDIVAQIRPTMNPDLELIIDVDPELPEILNTDVGKLKKILWHLITNGLKYTKEGGVYVRLSSVEEKYGINLCIEIRDTGIGMTAEELERICEGFYQANSGRSRSTNGLGLGMAIVSGFVKVLGGFMTINSRQGVGTTVHVSLPQQVIDDAVCMSVNDRARLVLGSFLNFGKYEHPQVREYYDAMLKDIVTGLGVEMHKVESIENLQKLAASARMTHLFVGPEEYEEGREYIESLAKSMIVVVVAKDDFEPAANSRVKILRKPFYCFPVISILNMDAEFEKEEGQLMCPGVEALVVDDEPMNLTVAKGIFKRYGIIVSTAANGPEAIEMCKQKEYDIVFMDHMMPGMDGVEAMKRIRTETQKARRDMPIVALTANAVSTAREMFMSEGFDGFVSKPIDITELERVMRRVLPKTKTEIVIAEEHGDIAPTEKMPKAVPAEKVAKSSSEEVMEFTPAEEVMEFAPTEEVMEFAPAEEVMEFAPTEEEAITGNGGQTDEAVFAKLKEMQIDYTSAMHYCKEDVELFKMLLLQFADEESVKERETARFLEEGKLSDYAILVHAVKSTAKLVGVLDLSEEARALELAAKEKNESFVKEHHNSMITHYREVAKSLHNLLRPEEKDVEEAADEDEVMEFEPEVE